MSNRSKTICANRWVAQMNVPFRSGAEIVLAMTEELGEVATEVTLLEQVGSKTEWSKPPSVERLGEELVHLLNTALALANRYDIDLDRIYDAQHGQQES